jgi:DNA repair photolyase
MKQYTPYGIRYTFQPYWLCSHECPYCYAKYGFRQNYWAKQSPTVVAIDFNQLRKDYLNLKAGSYIEAASSCDAFDLKYEPEHRITQRACREVFPLRSDIYFTWITKSHLIATYADILPKLSVPQITIESQHTELTSPYASHYEFRIQAVKLLSDKFFAVSARIDPVIPKFTPVSEIIAIIEDVYDRGCQHITMSTLKCNRAQIPKLKKAFDIKTSDLYFNKVAEKFFFKDEIRAKYARAVKKRCEALGMTFAMCMETVRSDTGLCDPFHLIDNTKRVDIKNE